LSRGVGPTCCAGHEHSHFSFCLAAFVLLAAGALPLAAPPPIDQALLLGRSWRSVGPFRGGRVSAVTGVVGQPGLLYRGLPLGGVWKTTSAGQTWYPIFDAVKEATSVGAIEVAPSDPNVIDAGMGDLITGGGINTRDLPAFNAVLTKNNLKPIAPSAPLPVPACALR
jgi:hypothetical protein